MPELSNEEARRRFGPPIYIVDGGGAIAGGGWGSHGSGDDLEVHDVRVSQHAGSRRCEVRTALDEPDESLLLWNLIVVGGWREEPLAFPVVIDEGHGEVLVDGVPIGCRTLRMGDVRWVSVALVGTRWVVASGDGDVPTDLALVELVEE
jgi:hypothetical protein